MTDTNFDAFEAKALADGFNEVLKRVWEPNQILEAHRHPFGVRAMVAEGEMWLTKGGETLHLRTGEHFTVAENELHAEKYGPTGATLWAARLHPL